MKKRGSHWADFHKILYSSTFQKLKNLANFCKKYAASEKNGARSRRNERGGIVN
jgi:hypothetical protein